MHDSVGAAAVHIGVMSGTSLDAVDAVVTQIQPSGRVRAISGASIDLPALLRETLLGLHAPGSNELDRAARASKDLAQLYASAVNKALQSAGLPASAITSIGVHGQTVRHRPDLGYTLQLNAPALLAELTGIDTVADFRSRDIAAGGQGAPLVPAFHAAQFAGDAVRVVLNMGGIANITVLGNNGSISGFDTGPANMLMDGWAHMHLGRTYDAGGRWAASGQCIPDLLASMLADPWFALAPPKSTGRDDFNLAWLERHIRACNQGEKAVLAPVDVQATLLQLTALSITQAINTYAPTAQEVLACGGGTQNTALMEALSTALPCPLGRTDDHGLPTQWVEAAAFAWLAWCYDAHKPAGLPAVTGASRPTILGCKYIA